MIVTPLSLWLVTVASSSLTLSLVHSLGPAAFGFGVLADALIAMRSTDRTVRKRQVFQREQDARAVRAQTMQAARILDSALMEAEALLEMSVVKTNRLWVDSLTVPDETVWHELRGEIAHILDPPAWITVNVGFLALGHMRMFEAGYRKLGYDDTTDLTPEIRGNFEPVLRDISAAREALHSR